MCKRQTIFPELSWTYFFYCNFIFLVDSYLILFCFWLILSLHNFSLIVKWMSYKWFILESLLNSCGPQDFSSMTILFSVRQLLIENILLYPVIFSKTKKKKKTSENYFWVTTALLGILFIKIHLYIQHALFKSLYKLSIQSY